MTPVSKTHWLGIWLSFLSGVVAAITVTKASPALIAMKDELQLSFLQIGWLMSSVAVATVLLGIYAGTLSRKHGPKKILQWALLLIFFSSSFGLFADTANQLLMSRVIEGIGIIFISVSAPTLISHLSKPSDMGLSMGVWALWMPVGSVFIFLVSPLVLLHTNWHWLWASPAFVALPLLFLLKFIPELPGQTGAKQPTALKTMGPILLALIFICFTGIFFSSVTYLPSYLLSAYQLQTSTAIFVTAILPLFIIPGNLISGFLIHRGLTPTQMMQYPAIALLILFSLMFNMPPNPSIGIVVLACFGFTLGMIPTAIFAQAPRLTNVPVNISRIMGIVVTGQGIGILCSPPLAGYLISEQQQWDNLYPLFMFFAMLIATLAQCLKRYSHRPD